jgi:hypothetical protein
MPEGNAKIKARRCCSVAPVTATAVGSAFCWYRAKPNICVAGRRHRRRCSALTAETETFPYNVQKDRIPVLEINATELMNRFRQPGGADWTGFVNGVLWAACWQAGIPESEVHTCLRTDIPDGGVDTRVTEASSTDVTGYLAAPSIWQYKAANEANLTDPDPPERGQQVTCEGAHYRGGCVPAVRLRASRRPSENGNGNCAIESHCRDQPLVPCAQSSYRR